jgi:hypothetical protein
LPGSKSASVGIAIVQPSTSWIGAVRVRPARARREVGVELIVIDSLSSLAGITADDPERWLRQFLDFQRHLGRAMVLVHHANRDGAMRGISGRADASSRSPAAESRNTCIGSARRTCD